MWGARSMPQHNNNLRHYEIAITCSNAIIQSISPMFYRGRGLSNTDMTSHSHFPRIASLLTTFSYSDLLNRPSLRLIFLRTTMTSRPPFLHQTFLCLPEKAKVPRQQHCKMYQPSCRIQGSRKTKRPEFTATECLHDLHHPDPGTVGGILPIEGPVL